MSQSNSALGPRRIKYNPAFLSEDDLVAAFVVRHLDLRLILDQVRENCVRSNQHLLVVGPRGSGKTSLLRRATIAIKRDPTLGAQWFPLVFAEESYHVTTPGELWLEAIYHLAEQSADASLARSHEELLLESNEDRLRERALALLLDFSDRVGKRLLMVIENLNMLTEQLSKDDAWTIRHTLQTEARIMFLTSATARFDAVDSSSEAFYGLFRLHELQPLDAGECKAVWLAITGKSSEGQNLRPIQILTGGNLRLLMIISRFGVKHSFDALMADLMHLVDEHTEYFKGQLDGLPPVERKVYLSLAELWSAGTARQVAERSRLDVHRASAMLGRLVLRGAASVAFVQGRTKYYQLTERLYNVYYLLRRRGAPSKRVSAVVQFMVGYYGEPEPSESITKDSEQLLYDLEQLLAQPQDVLASFRHAVLLVSELAVRGLATQTLAVVEGSTSRLLLEPLEVALRLHAGLQVLAPREIFAVATDIVQDINEREAALEPVSA